MSNSSAGYTPPQPDRESVCWVIGLTGDTVHTGTIRHDDQLAELIPGNPGWLLFDQNETPVDTTQAGFRFVECGSDKQTLGPVKWCFDTLDPLVDEVRNDGVSYSLTFRHRPGFDVHGLQVGTSSVPINIPWAALDTDGSGFIAALQTIISDALPRSVVTVTGGGATSICDTEDGSEFTITVACQDPEDAPTYLALRHDDGRDLISNPGFALDDDTGSARPNGQQWIQARRQDDAGAANSRVLCTDTAGEGWQTTDPAGLYEVWPRYANGTPSSGPGGNFSYYDTALTPRNTNVVELNSTANEGIVYQQFTVDEDSTWNIAATFGGRERTEQIRLRIATGAIVPTPGMVGDIMSVDVEARNVVGRGGPADPPALILQRFPWTEYQDSFELPAGTYTFAIIGPNTGSGIGGLFTDMSVFRNDDREQAFEATYGCEWTKLAGSDGVDRECQWWQPEVDDSGEISSWLNVENGNRLDTAAFFAQQPPPNCCDPIEEDEVPEATPAYPDTFHVEQGCGTVGGEENTPLFGIVRMAAGGFIRAIRYYGPNGARVQPSSWSPGPCAPEEEECCPEPIGRGCIAESAGGGEWVTLRLADGTYETVRTTDGTAVAAADALRQCPDPEYTTTTRQLAAGSTFAIPNTANLVAWAVRSRTGTVTVTVNGDVNTLDVNETITSASQDDKGLLTDTVSVATAASSTARISFLIKQ